MKGVFWLFVAMAALLGAWHFFGGGFLQKKGEAISVMTAQIKESGPSYEINAKYPKFGVPLLDVHIERAIDEVAVDIKNTPEPGQGVKNTFDSTYGNVYIGLDYISVKLELSQYTGGAHGMTTISGVNYDRAHDKILELGDALKLIGLTTEQLSMQVSAQLKTKLGSDFQSPEGVSSNPENFSSFQITKDAVTFIFQPYQVAAHAAGPQEVSIPRKK